MKIERGRREEPWRWLLVGTEGIGKTTFASICPDPIFLCAEEGTDELDVARARRDDGSPLESYSDACDVIRWLTDNPHEFKTLVIDTYDWLNHWLESHICEIECWKSIESPGYGKGHVRAFEEWRACLALLEKLQKQKRMNILGLAHATIKRYSPPDSEPFDRYDMKVSDKSSSLLREWSHAVFFAQHEVVVHKAEKEAKKGRGFSTGNRILKTTETAGVRAKNRYGLPAEMPFDRSTFSEIDRYRKMDYGAELEKLIALNPVATAKATEIRSWFEGQHDKAAALEKTKARFKEERAA